MKIKTITSPANEDIKSMRALDMRKERKETGLFLAEGLRHVIEGVDNGWDLVKLAYKPGLLKNTDLDRLKEKAELVLEVNDAVLEKLSHKDNPQSVIGVFRQKTYTLSDFDVPSPQPSPFNKGEGGTRESGRVRVSKCLVALEQVRDPGNLGTILRTVDAVGGDGVILIDQCCDPFSTEAVRASMGSLFAIPIAHATRAEFITYAKSFQGTVVGTALNDKTVDYRELKYEQPILLVMGNEQAGLTPELQDALPNTVKLPMSGRADSLNLAIATGVMLYKALES